MNVKEVIALVNRMPDEGVVERFQAILARHGVLAAWEKFERQFLKDTS